METVKFELIRRIVLFGDHFKIDFKERSLTIGRDKIIERGDVLCKGLKLETEFKNPLETLEQLYITYRDSRPTRTDTLSYFKAKSAAEMTDLELVLGATREIARAKLELYLLQLIIAGYRFEDFDKNPRHWYFKTESGLVLLREWF